jgi:lipopolysaccharide exporter
MSLTRTSFSGAFWLGSERLLIKAFAFLKLVVVARILSPTELGLFGIALIPYGFLEVLTELGFSQALIQTQHQPKKYLSSAWIGFFLRGLLIFSLLYLSAVPISKFFRQDLIQPIHLLALTPLLKGLINPAIVLFRKQLQFSREFFYQSLASVSESLATIILVIQLRSLLALPLGVVFGGLASLILSFILAKTQLGPISWQKIKDLFGYGRWVNLSGIISYLNDQGDDLLVSKLLGPQPLGLYQTAYKISNLPTTQGAGLIYQVIFPIFATIQSDRLRLKRGLFKSLAVTFFFSFVFVVFVFLTAPWFTRLFLGEKWLPMLPALNVLLIYGLSRPLVSVSSALFDSLGQPQVAAGLNLIKLFVLLLLILPLTFSLGIVGTAWAVVVAQLAVYPWFIIKLKQAFR